MELAPIVRAAEVLMSPLDWSSREAWLEESAGRVRLARGLAMAPGTVDALAELESLLRLPGEQADWLRSALEPAPGSSPRGLLPVSDAGEQVLSLLGLRCALAAGLAALHRLAAWRRTLGATFDDVDTGMAVMAGDPPAEVEWNARWGELLRAEPGRDRLLDAVARQAGRVARSASAIPGLDRELELPGGTYRIVVTRAPAGTLLQGPAVLVLLDRLTAALPTTQELRVTFGLRGREPQVALLAAEGLSNAAIAGRLRLSAHTVRHYLERVLGRLGLHSRKALALRLMMGGGERPHPRERR